MLFKFSSFALPLKMSFLIFSMVLNCMGIIILQLSGSTVSYSNLGFLEAFKDLPIAIISLFAANFINRFGSKKSLMFSLATVGICCLLLPFLDVFWFFKVWFAVIGISFAVAKISIYGIIRNTISEEITLTKVMSSVEASFMIGIFVVNLGFGWLISSNYAVYWKFGFWMISLLAVLNVFILTKTKMVGNPTSAESFSFSTIRGFFNFKTFLFFSIIFTIVFIEQNFNSWLPSFYKKHLKVDSFLALQGTAFLALFAFVGRSVTARIIHRFSLFTYFMMCVVVIFSMLIFAQVLLATSFSEWSLFLFPLMGLFLAPLYPVISSKMITNIHRDDINVFTSLIVIFSSLGSSFGSVMMSFVFQFNYGNYYALYISLAVLLLFILSFIYFKSYVSKKENND